MVRSPTPFGLVENAHRPSRGFQLPQALPSNFVMVAENNTFLAWWVRIVKASHPARRKRLFITLLAVGPQVCIYDSHLIIPLPLA